MKKYFTLLLVAIAILATSCKKENINEPTLTAGEGQFLATIAENSVQNAPSFSGADNSTQAAFNGNNVMWQVSDEILVNGTTFTCSRTQTNQAVFDNKTAQVSSPYHAFYPSTITNVNGNSGSLPATMTYDATKNANLLPMYATSSTRTLEFHNLCAALKITLPADFTASKIEISNLNNAINGAFTVDNNNVAVMHTTNVTEAEKKITITGTFTGGEVIYAPLPAGTYTNFTIRMLDGSNNQKWIKIIPTLTVAANKIYNVRIDKDDYFCFTAKAANSSVTVIKGKYALAVTLQYKTIINGTESAWSSEFQTNTTGTTISLTNVGDKVYFRAGKNGNNALARAIGSNGNSNHANKFSGTGNLEVSGNIMYLLNQNPSTSLGTTFTFGFLLCSNTALTDASKLVLPATTLVDSCYYGMFWGSNLATAPALPATTLAYSCYNSMFTNCNLTTAPALPATTLAERCYVSMFAGCSNLRVIGHFAGCDTSGCRINKGQSGN